MDVLLIYTSQFLGGYSSLSVPFFQKLHKRRCIDGLNLWVVRQADEEMEYKKTTVFHRPFIKKIDDEKVMHI